MRQLRSALAFVALLASTAGAQSAAIRVTVTDSASRPMEGITVSVIVGLKDVLASGVTDRAGQRTFRVRTDAPELQVAARRVGFVPATRVVNSQSLDTIRVSLTLARTPTRLDTVRVTAAQSAKRARTYIDADAIAESDRPMLDAIDVIEKLRPNMTLEPPDLVGACLPVRTLFINGKRWYLPPVDGSPPPNVRVIRGIGALVDAGAPKARPRAALKGAPLAIIVALNSIKPEHIEALEYHDCMDTSIEGGASALFVTLKPGIAFTFGGGSYVMPDSVAQNIARRVGLLPTAPTTLERFRMRILGVFDASTGAPIVDAQVIDDATNAFELTTETGTVSLAFMQPGAGRVIVRKPGFRTDTLSIRISPADTLPLTLLLTPIAR